MEFIQILKIGCERIMNEEALTIFTSGTAIPHIEAVLLKTASHIYENKDKLRDNYLKEIKRIFIATKEFSERTKMEVGYIAFSLLRTNLLYGKMKYDVHLYDRNWYLNDYEYVGEIDVADFFQPLEDAKEYLQIESRKFVNKVNASNVDNIISQHLEAFSHFFIKMFKYILVEATECSEYSEITKADIFRITTGELYGKPYILHIETKNRTTFGLLTENLKYEEPCQNLDLRNSDFAGKSIIEADLQYSDFRDSLLNGVDFSNSVLEGCIFANCNLSESKFIDSQISEANFHNADLRKANLTGVVSMEGVFKNADWDSICRFPLNLKGTDLREAIIANAVLQRVDFTQAKVDGAIFTGTDLSQCKFKKEQLQHIDLTEKQKSQIVII